MPKQEDRFRELILYLAAKSEGDRHFGSTKLNKLLFFCDFRAYRFFGNSISGQAYQKLQYGPCPRGIVPVIEKMVAEGECVVHERDHMGYPQKRLLASRDPDLSVFTPAEVDLINQVVEDLWWADAKTVSELSHEFIGWRAAEIHEEIPYETVFVDEPRPLTREEEAHAQEAIDEYLANVPADHPPVQI